MFVRLAVVIGAIIALTGPAAALDAGRLGVSPTAQSKARAPSLPSPLPPPQSLPPSSYAPAAGPAVQSGGNPDAIAVIIGNRTYAHGLPEVRYAENDASAVKRLVIEVLGYREGNVIDLRNASQAEMLSVFGNAQDPRGKLWAWIKPGASDVFVYYSGHGVPGLRDQRGYLLPVDADPATPEINGYPLDTLLANLAKLEARSVTVLLDACFSGNSAGGWLVRSASPVFIRTEAPPPASGVSVVSAAQADQVASWDEEARLGLFTRHVMDALLYGKADSGRGGNGDGAVTLGELESYLEDELTYAARRLFRRVQQASVTGDPKAVLVRRIAPVAVRPPPAVVAVTPPPATAGKYASPGPTIADAERFLATHWADVRLTIFEYYKRQGIVWDQKGNPPQVEFAEALRNINERRVVRVIGNSVDIWMRYRWVGGGTTSTAEATMRLSVAPDALAIEKMWR